MTGKAVALLSLHRRQTSRRCTPPGPADLGGVARIPAVLGSAGLVCGALTVAYGMHRRFVLRGGLHGVAQALHLAVGGAPVLIAVLVTRSLPGRQMAAAMV